MRIAGPALLCLLAAAPLAAQTKAPAAAPTTPAATPAAHGALLLVPMPAAAAWQDFAFLAALPVAAARHAGLPLVLATAEDGQLSSEQFDFVHRLRPSQLLWVGAAPAHPEVDGIPGERLAADSLDAAAAALAAACPPGPRAVIAPEGDYPMALVAAVLAARLQAPLGFAGAGGLPPATSAALLARGARSLLLVGEFAKAPQLENATAEPLRGAAEVARWMAQHELPVGYLAATAPADRTAGHVRKLSLAAAALAAGRRGALVPLGTEQAPPASAAAAQADLAAFRRSSGAVPELLCLCAMPEALPMATVPSGEGIDSDPPSDLSYGNTDADPFVELAVARFVAEDGQSGALQAARSLAYEELLSPSFAGRFAMAEWERLAAPGLENVGFEAVPTHPGGKPFDATSPLASVAVLVHGSHASWMQLGETVHHDSKVLLAPCLVESSGCSPAALDQDPQHRSVALRLLRNGACAFVGNSRRGVAQSEVYRSEFWNAVLAGQSLGAANRHALNCVRVLVDARGEQEHGLHRYQWYNAACYGDPAFVLHLPGPPRAAAARAELKGREVTVSAPGAWWSAEECIVADWKYPGPRITSWRGAGVGVDCRWDGEHKRNRDDLLYFAEVRTKAKVKGVVAVAPPKAPLGLDGAWSVDEHADGTRSVWFAVRLIDFDMDAGKVLRQVEKLKFRLE